MDEMGNVGNDLEFALIQGQNGEEPQFWGSQSQRKFLAHAWAVGISEWKKRPVWLDGDGDGCDLWSDDDDDWF